MKIDSKKVVLEFNLPDFERRDIKVKLSNDFLWIKADKKARSKEKKNDFFHIENSHQRFYYATTLPRVEPKKAKVEFKKGILKVSVPRK